MSTAAIPLPQQSWVLTETVWPTKLEIFTTWPFLEKFADSCSRVLFVRMKNGNSKTVHEEVWLRSWVSYPQPSAHPEGCPQLLWVGAAHEHPQLSARVTQYDSRSERWAPSINLTIEGTGDSGQPLGRSTSRTPRLSELLAATTRACCPT